MNSSNCRFIFEPLAIRACVLALLLSAAPPLAAQTSTTSFSSTLDDIPNPERGWSREITTNLTELFPSILLNYRSQGYRVFLHRQLLSPYWNVATLPQSFLDALNAGAALHRANGTKMVIQFSYDNVGGLPEPTLTTILGHIAQLKPFFTVNADVIAGVHGGFLGTYGEWAFSTEPSIGNPTPSAAARIAVRDALLAAVPTDIQIGWRTAPDLMAWYPTPLPAAQAFSGTNQARSGLHNDCFLSNPDDSGTYWAPGVSPTGRTPQDNKFRAYHAQMSDATTMGGENCGDGQYKGCPEVLTDGPLYHWRYLRDDWGTVYRDSWRAQGCEPQISRLLGYRFQLDAITAPQNAAPASVASVAVDLRNLGWSRIFSARKLVVTLRNTTSGAVITGSAGDMRLLPASATSSARITVPVAIPAAAAPGTYEVFLSIPDIFPSTKDNAFYAVRFANANDASKGQSWDAANFRFNTGTTLSVAPTAQIDTTPPTVPTGLGAVAASSSQINLTWNPSSDNVAVAGYRVFRNAAQVATTAALTFSDQGLLPATAYAYTVAAFDAAGNVSAQSAAGSATTPAAPPPPDTQAPSVPTGLVATAPSSTQVSLTWNASTDNVGVTGYYVYLNDVALTTTMATLFTHSGLTAGQTYNYRVSSYDAANNNSAWTATPVSVTTPAVTPPPPPPPLPPPPPPPPAADTQAPSVPAGLAGSALSSTQIRLTWTASTDNVGVTGYYVYLNDVALTTTAATAFTHSGLAAGTTYRYRVSSFDAANNNSAWTAAIAVTTALPADTQAPSVPTGLAGTALSRTRIRLTWNPSTDDVAVKGYYVYVNDVALTTTATTRFTHSGLTPGATYNYRVSAFDAVPNHSARTATPVSVKTLGGQRAVRADLNGDSKTDLLWRNVVTGENAVWLMNGAAPANTALASQPDLNWMMLGAGDFDGDGYCDILWRNAATGQNVIWLMNGGTVLGQPAINWVTDFDWKVVGVGDFDGDGKADILWRNSVTGSITIWLMNGATIAQSAVGFATADLNWSVAGVGDFDGDGKADILWRNTATGQNLTWLMNGTTILSQPVINWVTDFAWSIAGVGDFDGDGKADIVWYNNASGSVSIWLMNGAVIAGGAVSFETIGDLNWVITGVGDFDGDRKADVQWRNTTTGENTVWFMNGATILSRPFLPTVLDLNWLPAARR